MSVKAKEKKYLPLKHKAVASVLRQGKEKATLMSDIMSLTDIKEERQMYQIIEDLIVKYGYCIAGNKSGAFKGYYIISNESELGETLHTMEKTIKTMAKRHEKLRENYKSIS